MIKKFKKFGLFLKTNNFLANIITVLLLSCVELFFYTLVQDFTDNLGTVYILTYLFSLLLFYTFFKQELTDDIKNLKDTLKKNILNILIAFIIFTILTLITNNILISKIGEIASNESLTQNAIKLYPLTMGIAVLLLGPITEEIIFRLPFRYIKKHRFVAYIIYSILFALIHLTAATNTIQLLYFIPYFLLSLNFGYGFYKTNNIFVSIIIHIMYNSLNFMLLFIM